MLNLQGFSYFCAKEGAVALADLIGQLCDSPLFYIMSLDPQIKTSKLSNFILHQFEGIHKFWGAPFYREEDYDFGLPDFIHFRKADTTNRVIRMIFCFY